MYIIENVKVKVKVLPVNNMKTYRGSEGITPLLLNLCTRRRKRTMTSGVPRRGVWGGSTPRLGGSTPRLGGSTPPPRKFRRPSKIVPNSTRL